MYLDRFKKFFLNKNLKHTFIMLAFLLSISYVPASKGDSFLLHFHLFVRIAFGLSGIIAIYYSQSIQIPSKILIALALSIFLVSTVILLIDRSSENLILISRDLMLLKWACLPILISGILEAFRMLKGNSSSTKN